MDESKLLEQIQGGDHNAFRQLVDAYQVMIINTIIGFVHEREEAKDLAQEVFIQAYKSIGKFKAESSVSTWLYRIAVNKSLNYIRDNKKRSLEQSIDEPGRQSKSLSVPSAPESGSDYNLIETDRRRNLKMAIDSLPDNQKTAFILSSYDELSYREIADVMQLSISAVESLLFRARKNLQKKLIECYKKLNP